MVDIGDDFNSSDVELDPAPAGRWQHAGQASILEMLDHAFEDRIDSKRQQKQLTLTSVNENSAYANTLWWNRFREHQVATLNLKPSDTPTGVHIERFLSSIIKHVKPKSSTVPSYSFLVGGLQRTVNCCIFHYPSFHLSPHDRSRIRNHVESLWKQGLITKDPKQEKNWAGIQVVRILSHSLAQKALDFGVPCWDVVLAKMTSLVLTAALGCRTGDITKGYRDMHKLPFLAYGDIVIRLKGIATVDNLEVVVTLRNEKHHKNDPGKNRKVVLHPSPNEHYLDPVKLILIMALRSGSVGETAIETLLLNTSKRPNKTIQWKYPDRPLLCKFDKLGGGLLFDEPAGTSQLTNVMRRACAEAGLLTTYRAHDLRRGHFRETAHLPQQLRGAVDAAVSMSGGHVVTNAKVTAEYIGALGVDVWSKRQEFAIDDPFHAVEMAGEPYRPMRSDPKTVEAICEARGWNKNDLSKRTMASGILRKRHLDEWAEQNRDKRRAISDSLNEVPLAAHPSSLIDDASLFVPERSEQNETDDTEEEMPLDPALVEETAKICSIIDGSAQLTSVPEVEDMLIQHMVTDRTTDVAIASVDFVRKYSTINITTNIKLARLNPGALEGHSRDPVTLFRRLCRNAQFGCSYTSAYSDAIRFHEGICKYVSLEAARQMTAVKAHACTKCSDSFDSEEDLKKHVSRIHPPSFPCPCPRGCDVTVQDQRELQRHLRAEHRGMPSTKCLVPGCKSSMVFTRSSPYCRHLVKQHGLKGADSNPYLPWKIGFQPSLCKHAKQCKSIIIYKDRRTYARHLETRHTELTDEDIDDLIQGPCVG